MLEGGIVTVRLYRLPKVMVGPCMLAVQVAEQLFGPATQKIVTALTLSLPNPRSAGRS